VKATARERKKKWGKKRRKGEKKRDINRKSASCETKRVASLSSSSLPSLSSNPTNAKQETHSPVPSSNYTPTPTSRTTTPLPERKRRQRPRLSNRKQGFPRLVPALLLLLRKGDPSRHHPFLGPRRSLERHHLVGKLVLGGFGRVGEERFVVVFLFLDDGSREVVSETHGGGGGTEGIFEVVETLREDAAKGEGAKEEERKRSGGEGRSMSRLLTEGKEVERERKDEATHLSQRSSMTRCWTSSPTPTERRRIRRDPTPRPDRIRKESETPHAVPL